MAKTYSGTQRRRSSSSIPLITLGILIVGLVGGALLLHATGVVRIGFLEGRQDEPTGPDLTGLILVPRSARLIQAYSAVQREDVWDPATGEFTYAPLKPEQVTDDIVQDAKHLFGRVLRRDKPRGYIFTEADFFPKGTRPGPTAGVPPGKRAMRLRAADVPGLHGLNLGDRFDIVMSVSVELEEKTIVTRRGSGLDVEGPYADLHEALAEGEDEGIRVKKKRAEVRTIVNNGTVVQPVHQRTEFSTSSSLMRGSRLTTRPVEELIIALAPDEVAELNLALAVGATLHVAIRSGQVGSDEIDDGVIPDIEVRIEEQETSIERENGTVEPVKVIEVIRGGKKTLIVVPNKDDDDEEEEPDDETGDGEGEPEE